MKNTESQTATVSGQENSELTSAIVVRVPAQSAPAREDGGEVEALQWYGTSHDGMIPDADGEWLSRDDVELLQDNHRQDLIQLQAEIDAERQETAAYKRTAQKLLAERDALQSELTKARELLKDIRGANAAYTLQKIDIFLAHQSAPATKCVACEGAGRLREPGCDEGDCVACDGTGKVKP